MTSSTVYIGLGSNLDQPVQQIVSALDAINAIPQSKVTACSSAYHSEPMGPSEQPDYVNAVLQLETWLTAPLLLEALQAIERQQGRRRNGQRWGARTLDLDILLFADQIIATDALTVPHYGMKEREFVLYPLAEISPDLVLPCGNLLKTVLETCPRRGLKRLQHVELARAL